MTTGHEQVADELDDHRRVLRVLDAVLLMVHQAGAGDLRRVVDRRAEEQPGHPGVAVEERVRQERDSRTTRAGRTG